jgi:POT family proton-dependent oligopeptide transporter
VERDRIWVIIIMAFFVICFWAAFEQAGASLTFFAEEQTDRHLFGFEIPASFFQIINPTLIVILAPLMAYLWGYLGERDKEPTSLIKQSMGLVLVGVGYIFINFRVHDFDPEVQAAVYWLLGLYFIHTIAELCLSPIGLSMVSRLAPVRLSSLMMGVWFLSTAAANKFAGDLTAYYPADVEKVATAQASATTIKIAGDTTTLNAKIKIDSIAMAKSGLKDGGVWKVHLESDDAPKAQKMSYMEQFVANMGSDPLIKALFGSAKEDQLLSIEQKSDKVSVTAPNFKLKQIATPSKAGTDLLRGYSEDGSKIYVLAKKGTIQVWDLNPQKHSFLGFKIENLFQFFTIFTIMSIISGIILFILSRKMQTMMHGIK